MENVFYLKYEFTLYLSKENYFYLNNTMYFLQTLPKLENPEFPEFQFSSNPDLTGYGINFIKRELEEDASDDQQPKKAAKLTTSETCSEALARSPSKIFFLYEILFFSC